MYLSSVSLCRSGWWEGMQRQPAAGRLNELLPVAERLLNDQIFHRQAAICNGQNALQVAV
jgi:hypothetical protein